MEIITSRQNEKVLSALNYRKSECREKDQKVLCEGRKFISDLVGIKAKLYEVFYTVDNKDFVEEKLGDYAEKLYCVSEDVLKKLSASKTPQGIVAVVGIPCPSKSSSLSTNFLVLDGLQDPGNLGTILRTCVATNFRTIYLVDCVDVYNEKVVAASMTAIFRLNLRRLSRKEFLGLGLQENYPLIAADMNGQNALEFKNTNKVIGLVVGNEGNGISGEIKSLCKTVLSLPMSNGMESLNASVAAGVLMYCLMKK